MEYYEEFFFIKEPLLAATNQGMGLQACTKVSQNVTKIQLHTKPKPTHARALMQGGISLSIKSWVGRTLPQHQFEAALGQTMPPRLGHSTSKCYTVLAVRDRSNAAECGRVQRAVSAIRALSQLVRGML